MSDNPKVRKWRVEEVKNWLTSAGLATLAEKTESTVAL